MSSSTVVEEWPKMAQNGPGWSEMVPKGPKLPKENQNCQKKITKWSKYTTLTIRDILGHFEAIFNFFVCNFGPIWTILDHFWPYFHNCTGAHTDAQKLKNGPDRQMSAHTVQENHKQNPKIKNNLGKKVVYFISLFLDDTVDQCGCSSLT